MGEKGSLAWKVATLVCAVLLVGAAVAIVALALDRGGGEEEALRNRIAELEERIDEQEQEISDLQAQLAQAAAGARETEAGRKEEETATVPSDRDQLEALGAQMIDEDYYYVGEIVIDGDWARVGLAPKDPTKYQGDLAYFHKVNGVWTLVDVGTGLQYGDIPGAPESIFP